MGLFWGNLKMKKYLNELIEQFKQATGTKNVDTNSKSFISEFSEWVKSRKVIGEEYASFIDYMGVYPVVFSGESVEIGKGKYDSIALGKGIHMITPYSKQIKRTDAGIITADFRVYEGTPVMIKHNKGDNQFEAIDTQYIRRFLTHNPYEQSCIRDWEQLHNAGENITVGIFGSICDKDIEEKIKQIKTLRDGMTNSCFKEDYVTSGDSYCYAVSSSRKVKVKALTR